jgi:hypothetical protein
MSGTVWLADYERPDEIAYTFDRVTGEVLRAGRDEIPAGVGPSGMAAYQPMGVRVRTPVWCAVYTDGNRLMIRIGAEDFDASNEQARVRRRSLLPFIHAWVEAKGKRVSSWWYLMTPLEFESFPLTGDFIKYLSRVTANAETVQRYVHAWNATAKGARLASAEFQRELHHASAGR